LDEEKEKKLGFLKEHFDKLEEASDKDIIYFRAYLDELVTEYNMDAIRIKAACLFGGNKAFACDWFGARDLLKILVEEDKDAEAANMLGIIFFNGFTSEGKPLYRAALKYFTVGAFGGVAQSRLYISDMLMGGLSIPKNEIAAYNAVVEVYESEKEKLQSQNYASYFADAAYRLGNIYSSNIEFDEAFLKADYSKALKYYLEAQYAIEKRMNDYVKYGDNDLLAAINEGIVRMRRTGRCDISETRTTDYPDALYSFFEDDTESYRKYQTDEDKTFLFGKVHDYERLFIDFSSEEVHPAPGQDLNDPSLLKGLKSLNIEAELKYSDEPDHDEDTDPLVLIPLNEFNGAVLTNTLKIHVSGVTMIEFKKESSFRCDAIRIMEDRKELRFFKKNKCICRLAADSYTLMKENFNMDDQSEL
jgi:hypothetical protein